MYPGAYCYCSKPKRIPELTLRSVWPAPVPVDGQGDNDKQNNDAGPGNTGKVPDRSAENADAEGSSSSPDTAAPTDDNVRKKREVETKRVMARWHERERFIVDTLELITEDGVKLRAYLATRRRVADPPTTPKGTIIFFHGNHATPERMSGLFRTLLGSVDFGILAISYRGYGHSEGSPSEKGLCADAQAALDYVLGHPELGELVVIYGLSLGGAVAIDLVSKNSDKVHALIIDSTFTSIPKLMSRYSYLRPFLWTVRQKWESYKKIWRIKRGLPILMMSIVKDDVVLPEEMMTLFEIAKKRPGSASAGRAASEGKKGLLPVGRGLGFAFGSCWGRGDDRDEVNENNEKERTDPGLVSSQSQSPLSTARLGKVEAEARKSAVEFFTRFRKVYDSISAEPGGGTANSKKEPTVTAEDEGWYSQTLAKFSSGAERDPESGVEIKYFAHGEHGSTEGQLDYMPTLESFLNQVVEQHQRSRPTVLHQRGNTSTTAVAQLIA
ncbi:hypothetical protein AX16_011022 [Volvariella volvacea WC 439]|nr:hypothetical protein AX16_011022 [Volvariella volvacea WC 439]